MSKDYRDNDDLELWQLAKVSDDSLAFAELHRRYSPRLYALAVRKTGNSEVSEDLVQDLFVHLWLQRTGITIEKAFNLYLFSALKNRIISYLRKQLIQHTISLNDIDLETLSSQSANLVQEWLSLKEVQEIYSRELANLPEKSKQVFEMSRSGVPNKEIAQLLDLSEKTVEFHISKCLRVLRTKFGYVVNVLVWVLAGTM
ncbi:RNA polymerase sigma-70 factor (ECF subfamily) [Dyadobacter sp. BE34]|uniref:RNA polymerase sigma factor SigS n=1 Tax=Dyadobacter fermentans TaxID=94254 RepID=A0ABU1R523_9BACT|nr:MULTISPECIES: RNA polymerase sigma-70 factor [Dyadobacter]MDR6808498.1 RNA polymerase sigma-70 factor (ECF subfamily) [Dyadobacter fermentans]MDR7046241.1 RNA polymerase sigma-70 factor (ECF subfamily) [Dyadobacter sp. BE242]MDR7200554.1 RNA polymerase sigma-70 factor (ECF subfamily) [Dyadobacter sp. BE34]MDR7218514.1 RNA polymerase sigma-70 factor (ECF subfamily) [Dyadobacter sp. BE31]MDR7266444.1 RNA polymerase sigma-70 factor (ECF subfamily) [Dyadobacter sp. BE32]